MVELSLVEFPADDPERARRFWEDAPGVFPAPAPLFGRKDEDLATPRALAVLALVLFGLGFVVKWLVG